MLEGGNFRSDNGHCLLLLCAVTEKQEKNVYMVHGMVTKKGASSDRDLHTGVST